MRPAGLVSLWSPPPPCDAPEHHGKSPPTQRAQKRLLVSEMCPEMFGHTKVSAVFSSHVVNLQTEGAENLCSLIYLLFLLTAEKPTKYECSY